MKKFLGLAASLLLFAGTGQVLEAADYFARDFGAVPDGFTLNTRSIQAAIDYVVVHELAHIRYKDHSRAFYGFIESVLPDYRDRIKLLKGTQEA